MNVYSNRSDHHVGKLELRLNSTKQAHRWMMLAPERYAFTNNGTGTVLEPHELGEVTIYFKDSREIDELIDVLDSFRRKVCAGIGHWE